MRSIRWCIGRAGLVWVLLVAAGCVLSRTEPRPVHIYHLSHGSDDPIVEARPPGRTAPVLSIGLPQADPGFDTQRMAYLTRPYELSYYSANEWAEAPARMVGPLLVKALEQRGTWQAVVTAPTVLRADYRLEVTNLVLVQEFLQSPSRVRFSWRGQFIDLRGGQVLGTRRFEAAREAPSEDAYGGVHAANLALGDLLNETASWLETCLAGRGKAGC